MKKPGILILMLWGLSGSLKSQNLTPEEMKADMEVFKLALEAKHPEMYRYTSRSTFDSLFIASRNALDQEMSQREFYTHMAPLVVALRCGHTKWIISDKEMYYPFFEEDLFPLQIFFQGGKAYLLGAYSEVDVPVMSEVLSINNKKMENIIPHLLDHLSFADGKTLEGKYYQLNHHFPGIFSTFYGTHATYEVEILNEGKNSRLFMEGVNLEDIQVFQKKKEPRQEKGPLRFSIQDEKVGWMDIDRFFTYPNEPRFKKFLKESFAGLKESGIEDLVLDLRGNEGGNETWGQELYSYLAKSPFRYYERISVKKHRKTDFKAHTSQIFKLVRLFTRKGQEGYELNARRLLKLRKPKKNAFEGNLYVLLDGQSFSVTTEFAARAKADGRAVFVGEETSGGYAMNTSGFFSIVTLPHSKIELGIPLLGFHMANLTDSNPFARGIIPDFEVKPSASNLIKGEDPVCDFVLSLILQSNNSSSIKN